MSRLRPVITIPACQFECPVRSWISFPSSNESVTSPCSTMPERCRPWRRLLRIAACDPPLTTMPFCERSWSSLPTTETSVLASTRIPLAPPAISAFSTATLRAPRISIVHAGGVDPAWMTAPAKSTLTSCPEMVSDVSATRVGRTTVTWADPTCASSAPSWDRRVPLNERFGSDRSSNAGSCSRFVVTVSAAVDHASCAVRSPRPKRSARWRT